MKRKILLLTAVCSMVVHNAMALEGNARAKTIDLLNKEAADAKQEWKLIIKEASTSYVLSIYMKEGCYQDHVKSMGQERLIFARGYAGVLACLSVCMDDHPKLSLCDCHELVLSCIEMKGFGDLAQMEAVKTKVAATVKDIQEKAAQ